MFEHINRLQKKYQPVNFLSGLDSGFDNKLPAASIRQAPDPLHSPGQSPGDFWMFRFLKESMKGMELTTEEYSVEAIAKIRRGVILKSCNPCFCNGCDD
jgi:hypothetical protein